MSKCVLQEKVEQLCRSDRFASAPTQCAILHLLASYDGANPTQFDIATGALGKDDSFDERVDSCVRTHISRLRKALEGHYASVQPDDGMCLYIRKGEYRLRMGSLAVAYPALSDRTKADGNDRVADPVTANVAPPPGRVGAFTLSVAKPRAMTLMGIIAAFVSCVLFAVSHLQLGDRASASEISSDLGLTVPVVRLHVRADDGVPAKLIARVRSQATSVLEQSLVSQYAPEKGAIAHYTATVRLMRRYDTATLATVSLHDLNGELRHETRVEIADEPLNDWAFVDTVRTLVEPSGPIARALVARIPQSPRNMFECFLTVENKRSAGDGVRNLLRDCLQRFPDGEYGAYLEARQLFARFGRLQTEGVEFSDQSAEWSELSLLLQEHPTNSWANMLAAKIMAGKGRCSEAVNFAQLALNRGSTYAALELSIGIDLYHCTGVSRYQRKQFEERVEALLAVHENPSEITQNYLLLAVLGIGDLKAAQKLANQPFDAVGLEQSIFPSRQAYDHLLDRTPVDREAFRNSLKPMIYNRVAIDRILATLDAASTERTRFPLAVTGSGSFTGQHER